MLQELSTVFRKYGYSVELIPLAPGHAWNRTDARIAHLNTFFNNVKRKRDLFGAQEYAACLHEASDPTKSSKRKLLQRSQVFFREVVHKENDGENLGAALEHSNFSKGHRGVRGFLYFDFSFEANGHHQYPPGYARVRVYGDPDRHDNPTYVYSWRKDLSKAMCQTCSDQNGCPILLTVSGCTKQACKVGRDREGATAAARAHHIPLPLSRRPLRTELEQPIVPRKRSKQLLKKKPKLPNSKVLHAFCEEKKRNNVKEFDEYPEGDKKKWQVGSALKPNTLVYIITRAGFDPYDLPQPGEEAKEGKEEEAAVVATGAAAEEEELEEEDGEDNDISIRKTRHSRKRKHIIVSDSDSSSKSDDDMSSD